MCNKQISLFLLILLFPFQKIFSQNKTINGYVVDEKSGEYLPYATIVLSENRQCTTTNNYGYFSMKVDSVNYFAEVSYVGYQPKKVDLSKVSSDSLITIKLGNITEIDEVIVHGNKGNNNIPHLTLNSTTLSMKELDRIPVVLGEKDVLKTLQLMPGFSGGLEGTSGLYVRGGSPDQNQLLLDGVTVYNANHLFGLFSVFNSNALKSVNAIKGAFPARYGGRLSSVIDIQMKEGNNQHYGGELSIGLLSSNFTFEGPIIKDKTSFIISGRRTYYDLFTRLICATNAVDGEESTCGYYFYDLNAKVNHKINDKSHLFLSVYSGYDKAFLDSKATNYSMEYIDKFNLNWGNRTISLRYNYIIKPNLFANITTIYSHYQYSHQSSQISNSIYLGEIENESTYSFTSSSGINDLGIKFDFDLYGNQYHSIKFGGGYIRHEYIPEINTTNYSSEDSTAMIDTSYGSENIYAGETYLYIEDGWNINEHLRTNIGLRLSSFSVRNKDYLNLDPRFSITYLASNRLSFEGAYSHMYQNTHLLTNSSSGLPTDLWLPATDNVPPAISNQFTIGSLYKINTYEFSTEAYYKNMKNLIEYTDESYYYSNFTSWEDEVESGKGVSYGLEFSAHKYAGSLTGWVGYTLSWSNREFEHVNNGNSFPSSYDRRHDFSIVTNYKFNEHFDIGVTWVYSSGLPITLPIQKYTTLNNETTYVYSERNGYRMSDYHRMDLCANFRKEKKRGERIWTISIYNVYNHLNPLFVETTEENGETKFRQYSVPIIPSISYTFRFK